MKDERTDHECRYRNQSCGPHGFICDLCREDRADARTVVAVALQTMCLHKHTIEEGIADGRRLLKLASESESDLT